MSVFIQPNVVLTIGHSNRSLHDFLALLAAQQVEMIVDVRKLPGSKKFPHFNADALGESLGSARIAYLHAPELGGRRRPRPDSPNGGWRNQSFRGFADYMLTTEFDQALTGVLRSIGQKRAALMCSEAVPWRCHRFLIADALVVRNIRVEHIISAGKTNPHLLNRGAIVEGHHLFYPPPDRGEAFSLTMQ
jgi:uncharacterized protein (DUF488 family)